MLPIVISVKTMVIADQNHLNLCLKAVPSLTYSASATTKASNVAHQHHFVTSTCICQKCRSFSQMRLTQIRRIESGSRFVRSAHTPVGRL